MILTILILFGAGPDPIRAVLEPFDFQRQDDARFYLANLGQVESDGRRLYLSSPESTEVLVVDADGKVVKTIGGSGDHPAELGHLGVYAMAVRGDVLWLIDSELKRARRFVDGVYQSDFRVKAVNHYAFFPASNGFAFTEREIVIPGPHSGDLATVYARDGQILRRVGRRLRATDELEATVPGIHDTIWIRRDQGWLSVHKFFPIVVRYDPNFRKIGEYQIESPAPLQLLDELYRFDPSPERAAPNAVITDAKMFRNELYLMSGGRLHRVDPDTGRVKSIMTFSGRGPDFSATGVSEPVLYFFAFLDDGRLFVAHPAMLWNHDLWTTIY